MSDLAADKPRKLSPIKRDILDIVRGAHRYGDVDMTAMEIQRIYEERIKHGRVSDGYFAGRVSELVDAGHLLRAKKRQCRATLSAAVNAVYVPSLARAVPVAAISASSADCY